MKKDEGKKKKVSEMTQKEIWQELEKVNRELEKQVPKVVGGLIKISKSFYALSKDERKREALFELLRTDENFRRDLRKTFFDYDSAIHDLVKTLDQAEELSRLKVEELLKKREELKKKEKKE